MTRYYVLYAVCLYLIGYAVRKLTETARQESWDAAWTVIEKQERNTWSSGFERGVASVTNPSGPYPDLNTEIGSNVLRSS